MEDEEEDTVTDEMGQRQCIVKGICWINGAVTRVECSKKQWSMQPNKRRRRETYHEYATPLLPLLPPLLLAHLGIPPPAHAWHVASRHVLLQLLQLLFLASVPAVLDCPQCFLDAAPEADAYGREKEGCHFGCGWCCIMKKK